MYSESSHDGEHWALLLSEFVNFTSFGLGERRAPAACGRRGSETARGLLSSSGAGHRLGTRFLGNNDFFSSCPVPVCEDTSPSDLNCSLALIH